MSSSSNGHSVREGREPASDRELRLADLAISDLKEEREHTPQEYRLYKCNHTGEIVFLPIYYGKQERGG